VQDMFEDLPPGLRRWLELAKIDLSPRHGQPTLARCIAALIVANAGSLIADAILVAIGTAIFPSTRGFAHFQPSDYGKLTIVGVTLACLSWPIVTRFTSEPRWVFLRLAVLVTLCLWLPDLWIRVHGEISEGAAVLMAMALAIALIACSTLVRVIPIGRLD